MARGMLGVGRLRRLLLRRRRGLLGGLLLLVEGVVGDCDKGVVHVE